MNAEKVTIIRAPHGPDNPYFQMLRASAQDSRLSFEARGVLTYLLSKPGNWKLHPSDLMREGGCGRDRVKRILKELKDLGYLVATEDKQPKGERGKFTAWNYVLYEQPQIKSPFTEKPSTDKPSTENPLHTEDRDVQKIELQEKHTDAPAAVSSATQGDKPKRTRTEKQQKLDAMKNALADAFGLPHHTVTNTKWKEFGKAGAELILVGATPEDMMPLYQWSKTQWWGKNGFTSIAMAKHWPEFVKARKNEQKTSAMNMPSPTLALEKSMYGGES